MTVAGISFGMLTSFRERPFITLKTPKKFFSRVTFDDLNLNSFFYKFHMAWFIVSHSSEAFSKSREK